MQHDDNFRTSSVSGTPKLIKALGHLTTPISTLRFNHDAQILAMASKDKKDAMRLVGLVSWLPAFLRFITSRFPLFLGHGQPYDFLKFAVGQWPKLN